MNPRVAKVVPLENHTLELLFTDNQTRLFDVKPYLDKGIFSELQNITIFNTAKVFNGTVIWENELDFCPDTLFLESVTQELVHV